MYVDSLPPILNIMDIAGFLRISRSAAYALLNRPDFPAIRIGRTVRVSRDSFVDWLQKQENQTLGAK